MKQVLHNIALSLERATQTHPSQTAITESRTGSSISFQELYDQSSLLASGLNQYGVKKGDRVLIFVPFSIQFISIAFALFKAQAIPVFIDPGLGKKNILQCIKESEPHGIIATPIIHIALKFLSKPFRDLKYKVNTTSFWPWGGCSLKKISTMGESILTHEETLPSEPAAILFTSGSTGPPKGVVYTHEMFSRQLEVLRYCYQIKQQDVDLSTFPLFSLFGVGIGMTSIIPEMDFSCPAKVNPEKILKTISKYKITSGFGSPALWNTISRYCISNNRNLYSINRILMAGAPIPGSLLEKFDHILKPNAKIHTPYGATEALPVTTIERKELSKGTYKKSQQGYGTCVGRAVPGIKFKIIKITDASINQWNDSLELTHGEIGEVVVKGQWVTRNYFNHNKANGLAKIKDHKNTFWHRMGDVGYIDDKSRLWFCGRKSQRVQTANRTLFTIQCEGVFNAHPMVKRSALVGVGKLDSQKPVIVIEPEYPNNLKSDSEQKTLIKDLLNLKSKYNHTLEIENIFIHLAEFPVDIRHNAKIFREKLAQWAAKKMCS